MSMHFVSYPKSGRTWIRFILSRLNHDEKILFHHDGFEFNDPGKPPHSFSLSDRLKRYSDAGVLVYLERDPRDVMVSLYHQVTGRFDDFFGYTGSVSEFLRDDYFGARNLRRFRDMWQTILGLRPFLKISYEDCHRDVYNVLRQILDYYRIEVDETNLQQAISDASFANMQTIEASMVFPEPWLRYRNGSPKVREGLVNGFQKELTETDIEFLNEVFGLTTLPRTAASS